MYEAFDTEIGFDHLDLSGGARAFDNAIAELRNMVLQIPPFKDPVEWTPENIELPKTETFRPGPMRFNGFQRPVARAAMEPDTDQITVLKGVQVGWSSFLKVMLLYGVSYLALSVVLAQPTAKDAEGYYKDQIEPRFQDTKSLLAIRRTPGRGEVHDTWDEHRFSNGGRLYFRGAASDDAFRRISADWQMADEVDADAWQSRGETSQADKLALFRDRGTARPKPILWVGSTPLARDTSVVWREWLLSDQRRFHVACPHCGTPQYLKWGSDKTPYGFRWKTNDHGHVIEAWYQCEEKGCRIDEHHKEEMVENGEYIAKSVGNRPGHKGFHWPAWHSSAPKAAWTVLAQQWIDAQGNPELLKRFINNVMAEPWDDLGGQAMEADDIRKQQVAYAAEVPDDVVAILAGVDTQSNKEGLKDGIADEIASREISVVGFSARKMPRLIAHYVVLGEPGDPVADAELDAIRRRKFAKRDGTLMPILATAIDMGGHYGDQTKAYAAARRGENVWAVKGRNITLGARSASVWPKKVSSRAKSGSQWYMIDTQLAKDAVARMLFIRGPGGPMFPKSVGDDYFDGLTAEKLMINKKGQRYWKRKGKNTGEPWDCLVYAYAALCGLQASSKRYRDLNLAEEALGMKRLPPHDPETGELLEDLYAGPDMSVMSVLAKEQKVNELQVSRPKAVQQKQAPVQKNAETAIPRAVSTHPSVAKVKRKGGVVRSTNWRW